jgi:hypothetical protein
LRLNSKELLAPHPDNKCLFNNTAVDPAMLALMKRSLKNSEINLDREVLAVLLVFEECSKLLMIIIMASLTFKSSLRLSRITESS